MFRANLSMSAVPPEITELQSLSWFETRLHNAQPNGAPTKFFVQIAAQKCYSYKFTI